MRGKFLFALIALICLIVGVVFFISNTSAYPYQLNLTDGTLIDLNTSINMTNNITIYIIHENASIVNNTYTLNNSYFNNTYINNTNTTIYYWNGTTNSTFDERFTLFDARYIEETEFSSYKTSLLVPTKAEFDALTTKVNNIDVTETTDDSDSNGGMWLVIIICLLLSVCAMVISGIIMKKIREDPNEKYSLS